MLGFKRFETAAVTIRGIELAAKIEKATIRPHTPHRKAKHRSRTLGRRSGGLRPGKPNSPSKNIHLRKFAPEPIHLSSMPPKAPRGGSERNARRKRKKSGCKVFLTEATKASFIERAPADDFFIARLKSPDNRNAFRALNSSGFDE